MARARGSIKLVRPGVYRIRIDAGLHPATGRRVQPSRTVYGTRREAQVALSMWLAQVDSKPGYDSALTVDDLFEQWLSAPSRGGRPRKPSTVYRERSRYNTLIAPGFGGRVARSVSAGEITRFFDTLIVGRGLSPASVRRVYETMKAMYNFAVRREVLSDNPLNRVVPPSCPLKNPEAPEVEVVGEHLARLRDTDPLVWLAVRMTATLGLRRSDVLALRWRHINLDSGAIHVYEGATWTPGIGLVISTTKTGDVGQAVLLADAELLHSLRERFCDVARVAQDVQIDPQNLFLFARSGLDTSPMHCDTLTSALRKHCERNPDLPRITPQMLRVFTASELESNGDDSATAQAVLRHRSPYTTLRHYRASRERRVRSATRALGDRLAQT